MMRLKSHKLSKRSNVLTRIIDSRAVVIFLSDDYDDALKKEVYIFNETGTRVWELINGKNNIKEIVDKIYPEYDLTLREAREHIKNFVDKLLKNKLLENPQEVIAQ